MVDVGWMDGSVAIGSLSEVTVVASLTFGVVVGLGVLRTFRLSHLCLRVLAKASAPLPILLSAPQLLLMTMPFVPSIISIAVETRLCWLAVEAAAAESSLRQAIVRHWCAVVGLNHAPALSTRLLTPTEFTIC